MKKTTPRQPRLAHSFDSRPGLNLKHHRARSITINDIESWQEQKETAHSSMRGCKRFRQQPDPNQSSQSHSVDPKSLQLQRRGLSQMPINVSEPKWRDQQLGPKHTSKWIRSTALSKQTKTWSTDKQSERDSRSLFQAMQCPFDNKVRLEAKTSLPKSSSTSAVRAGNSDITPISNDVPDQKALAFPKDYSTDPRHVVSSGLTQFRLELEDTDLLKYTSLIKEQAPKIRSELHGKLSSIRNNKIQTLSETPKHVWEKLEDVNAQEPPLSRCKATEYGPESVKSLLSMPDERNGGSRFLRRTKSAIPFEENLTNMKQQMEESDLQTDLVVPDAPRVNPSVFSSHVTFDLIDCRGQDERMRPFSEKRDECTPIRMEPASSNEEDVVSAETEVRLQVVNNGSKNFWGKDKDECYEQRKKHNTLRSYYSLTNRKSPTIVKLARPKSADNRSTYHSQNDRIKKDNEKHTEKKATHHDNESRGKNKSQVPNFILKYARSKPDDEKSSLKNNPSEKNASRRARARSQSSPIRKNKIQERIPKSSPAKMPREESRSLIPVRVRSRSPIKAKSKTNLKTSRNAESPDQVSPVYKNLNVLKSTQDSPEMLVKKPPERKGAVLKRQYIVKRAKPDNKQVESVETHSQEPVLGVKSAPRRPSSPKRSPVQPLSPKRYRKASQSKEPREPNPKSQRNAHVQTTRPEVSDQCIEAKSCMSMQPVDKSCEEPQIWKETQDIQKEIFDELNKSLGNQMNKQWKHTSLSPSPDFGSRSPSLYTSTPAKSSEEEWLWAPKRYEKGHNEHLQRQHGMAQKDLYPNKHDKRDTSGVDGWPKERFGATQLNGNPMGRPTCYLSAGTDSGSECAHLDPFDEEVDAALAGLYQAQCCVGLWVESLRKDIKYLKKSFSATLTSPNRNSRKQHSAVINYLLMVGIIIVQFAVQYLLLTST